MSSPRLVVSPHLDDAVLSCWHVLAAGDATVVTVFSGLPEPGTSGWWDRLTGSTDSVARLRERLREDDQALALAGAESVRLGLLDEQYRSNGAGPSVAEALAPHVASADVVYAPLGLFFSGDHGLVRDALLEMGEGVTFYADHPHVGLWGLPGWVTGDGEQSELDVDAAWRYRMVEGGIDPESLRPNVHALDPETFERKLAAVREYRTQVTALEREAPLDQLRWEVTWTR